MFGNYPVDRMVAHAKMTDLRQQARTHRLSKRMLGDRRAGSWGRWIRNVQRVVRSILP